MVGRRRSWWWGAVLVGASVSCATPRTEVLVEVTTDLPWGPAEVVRSVVVTVRAHGGSRGPCGRGGFFQADVVVSPDSHLEGVTRGIPSGLVRAQGSQVAPTAAL